jgi:hypothetical protein
MSTGIQRGGQARALVGKPPVPLIFMGGGEKYVQIILKLSDSIDDINQGKAKSNITSIDALGGRPSRRPGAGRDRVAGPVRNLRIVRPKDEGRDAPVCPKCHGRLLSYDDDPYFYYCPECRRNVMVVNGEALEEVA